MAILIDGVWLVGNETTQHPACTVRLDYSSSRNVGVLNR